MLSEPKVEYRDEQPYVGIRTRAPMPDFGPMLGPLWGETFERRFEKSKSLRNVILNGAQRSEESPQDRP